jgi:hypothetical protein
MGLDLIREAKNRIEKVKPNAVGGGVILVSEFMKGTFVAGLKDDRVKYIVKAREGRRVIGAISRNCTRRRK